MTEATKTQKKGWSLTAKALAITLVLMVLCSLVNWGVVTGWGNIEITHLTLVGDNGLKYTALMYVPSNASNENPAPANLMIHGSSGNGRNHESWAMEFARRGFIVLSVDDLGSGDAEWSIDNGSTAVANMFCNYLVNQPMVDTERLVISGHSAGCQRVYEMGKKYDANTIILCGGVRAAIPKEDDPYLGNMLSIIGGAESLRTYETENENTILSFQANGVELEDGVVEYGHVYGSFEEGNAKMAVFNEGQVHEGAFVDKNNLVYQLDFVQSAMEVPNYIDPNDQVWMVKDFTGLAGTLVFAAFLVALYLYLMEHVTVFQSIQQPMPRNIGLRGKGLAISIAAALIFPAIVLYTGSFGLWDFIGTENFALFPLQQANRAFVTVIGLNIMGLIMLGLFMVTEGRKHKAGLRELGMTSEGKKGLDWKLIGKSFVLAMIVIAIGFSYISAQSYVLGTDFYAWFFGIRPIPSAKFQYFIPYIIVWMLCFVVTQLGLNVERRLPSTGSETKDTIIAIVFNAFCACFTVTFFVVLQNALQLNTELGVAALGSFKADMTRLWGMPVGMFVAGAGHTAIYRKTGSIWPGVFLMGTLCALMCCLYGQIHL